jgi:hypothetical protein
MQVCGEGVEVGGEDDVGHVGAILWFRVVVRLVDGTLVDATAIGILASSSYILQLGEFSTWFRVSCLGGVLAVDICCSVEQTPIWPFHDRRGHDHRPRFPSSEVSHRSLRDTKCRNRSRTDLLFDQFLLEVALGKDKETGEVVLKNGT